MSRRGWGWGRRGIGRQRMTWFGLDGVVGIEWMKMEVRMSCPGDASGRGGWRWAWRMRKRYAVEGQKVW